LIRKALHGLRRRAADDSGVAALLVIGLVAIVAFTALSVFLNTYIGDRRYERARAAAAGAASLLPSVLSFYNQQDPVHTLPCPDTTFDGEADACAAGDTSKGVLPWVTLGLSRDAVIDTYGNFYDYVVSEVGKNVCETVSSDIPGAAVETTYTGALLDPTDLALVDASGASRNVAFVIIGHGENGLGATRSNENETEDPTSDNEIANADDSPNTVYSGPHSIDEDTYFDDQVFAPSNAELQKTCETLTPGGQLNADITESFDGGDAAIDDEKFDVSGTDPPTKTRDANNNGVALFTDGDSYLSTDGAYNFTPTVRPVYVAALWTPDPNGGATASGFSIATRATEDDLGASTDIFDQGTDYGITFRFDDRTPGNIDADGEVNTLSINDQSGALFTSSGSAGEYDLIAGETYLIEVYDNGDDVWMRITQKDDASNTAFLAATNVTSDLFGDQRVMFINGPSESYIDDVVVGVPMLALEIGDAGGYAATADEDNDNGTGTGDITLEAWIRPRSLPGAGEIATIVSKWDTADTDSGSFRLFLDGDHGSQLALSIDDAAGTDDAEDFDLGFKPPVDMWSHIAVTYDASENDIRLYVNGALSRVVRSQIDASGIKAASQEFMVGAEQDNDVAADFFHGYISDVRVWSVVRDADNISDHFQRRLSVAGSESGLVANWKFDRESGTVGGSQDVQATPASAIDGVLTTATYSPILSNYFRPLSTETDFCPVGTRAGPYQCDFRTSDSEGRSDTITVPSNLSAIYAKVWGGGGGGYDTALDSSGGSGGFSQGQIQTIGALATIAGQDLDINVGGGGTGSTTTNAGANGGGGSGIFATDSGDPGLLAGGGGGASYSNDATIAGGVDCAAVAGTVNQCGLGGNGAGATVTTTRANGGTTCGGRGGDDGPFGTDPPTTGADCDAGGGDPGTPEVYNGGGLAVGGAAVTAGAGGPDLVAGGTGYEGTAMDTIAAGGGGGGASGGEAGGFDDTASTSHGYGGGGGSGYYDATGVISFNGEAGSVTVSAAFTDATRSGTIGNHTNIVSLISPDLSGAPIWRVGCSIDGTNIHPNATIVSIKDNASITLSHNTTGSTTPHVVALTVDCAGGFVPAAGGVADPYYYPAYLADSGLLTPGTGGTVGAEDGHAGAVVLAW